MPVHEITAPDGLVLVAEDAGPAGAPDVLLLGGITMACAYWSQQIEALSRSYHVIAPDCRDVGDSRRPEGPYDAETLTDDVVAVLDAFDVDAAHVAGFSLGGCVGLQLAARHPERVRSLATSSCWARPTAHTRQQFKFWLELAEKAGWELVFEMNLFMSFSEETLEELEPALRALGSEMMQGFDQAQYRRQVMAAASHSLSDAELAGIRAPYLSLYGTEDLLVPRRYAEQLAAAVPGAELAPIPGVSHAITVDHPERWLGIAQQWFDRNSGS